MAEFILEEFQKITKRVRDAFKVRLVTIDDVLAYSDQTQSFYALGNSAVRIVSDDQADVIINANLENWFKDGHIFEETLGIRNIGRCPRCKMVRVLDALSRKDNVSHVCSTCGTDEALEEWDNFRRNV